MPYVNITTPLSLLNPIKRTQTATCRPHVDALHKHLVLKRFSKQLNATVPDDKDTCPAGPVDLATLCISLPVPVLQAQHKLRAIKLLYPKIGRFCQIKLVNLRHRAF